MSNEKCIAFIGLHVMMSMCLKNEMRKMSDMRIETFGSYMDFLPLSDKVDACAVSASVFIDHLDFFLPRKNKILVVDSAMTGDDTSAYPFKISGNTDESQVNAVVSGFLDSLREDVDVPGELSIREKEVLRLIASGKLNKEIADELCISVNTVITHRKNLSGKLGIKSASGLSLYAMMNGLI